MRGLRARFRRTAGWTWRLAGYLPLTVAVVAGVGWLLLSWGVTDTDVTFSLATAFNPLWYFLSMVIHDDWAHFYGNMELFIPFGLVLTWLSSNRHVLVVILAAQFAAAVLSFAINFGPGVGSSLVVFAVVAAALVRAVGYALQFASSESLQTVVAVLLALFAMGLFLIAVLAGGHTRIDHFGHFFAFLFGGAIEAMYVFSGHETETVDRADLDRFVN